MAGWSGSSRGFSKLLKWAAAGLFLLAAAGWAVNIAYFHQVKAGVEAYYRALERRDYAAAFTHLQTPYGKESQGEVREAFIRRLQRLEAEEGYRVLQHEVGIWLNPWEGHTAVVSLTIQDRRGQRRVYDRLYVYCGFGGKCSLVLSDGPQPVDPYQPYRDGSNLLPAALAGRPAVDDDQDVPGAVYEERIFEFTIHRQLPPFTVRVLAERDNSFNALQARRIEIARGDGEKTVQVLVDGVGLYAEWGGEPMLAVEDVNFDGYGDLRARHGSVTGNIPYDYFLFDPERNRFKEQPVTFMNPTVNPATRTVRTFGKAAWFGEYETFAVRGDAFVLIRREYSGYDQDKGKTVTRIEELRNGRMVVVREEYDD